MKGAEVDFFGHQVKVGLFLKIPLGIIDRILNAMVIDGFLRTHHLNYLQHKCTQAKAP